MQMNSVHGGVEHSEGGRNEIFNVTGTRLETDTTAVKYPSQYQSAFCCRICVIMLYIPAFTPGAVCIYETSIFP